MNHFSYLNLFPYCGNLFSSTVAVYSFATHKKHTPNEYIPASELCIFGIHPPPGAFMGPASSGRDVLLHFLRYLHLDALDQKCTLNFFPPSLALKSFPGRRERRNYGSSLLWCADLLLCFNGPRIVDLSLKCLSPALILAITLN